MRSQRIHKLNTLRKNIYMNLIQISKSSFGRKQCIVYHWINKHVHINVASRTFHTSFYFIVKINTTAAEQSSMVMLDVDIYNNID